jgi:hypothetical protein
VPVDVAPAIPSPGPHLVDDLPIAPTPPAEAIEPDVVPHRRVVATLDDGALFAPLRVEPPPRIYATWWLRYVLFVAQMVGIVVVLLTEYAGPGRLAESNVVAPYLLAAVMLVCWSALAMIDAGRLVPATAYQRRSSPTLAVGLWLLAFAAPVMAFRVVDWARERFAEDPDDIGAAAVTGVAVLIAFIVVWLPFRYHTQQAHRIGAPGRVVAMWFWLPVGATVGVLLIAALGLRDLLADGGMTDLERTVEVAVVLGAPMLVFALTTWRATTVFDEVIDLRWRRWKTEWEQTLVAMAAQPVPGAEAASAPGPHH